MHTITSVRSHNHVTNCDVRLRVLVNVSTKQHLVVEVDVKGIVLEHFRRLLLTLLLSSEELQRLFLSLNALSKDSVHEVPVVVACSMCLLLYRNRVQRLLQQLFEVLLLESFLHNLRLCHAFLDVFLHPSPTRLQCS